MSDPRAKTVVTIACSARGTKFHFRHPTDEPCQKLIGAALLKFVTPLSPSACRPAWYFLGTLGLCILYVLQNMSGGSLHYDGNQVLPDDTLAKLEYEEEYEMDVFAPQSGG